MSYGYGGSNPYDQRDESPSGGYGAPSRGPPQAAFGQGPRPGGGRPGYNQVPSMGRDDYGGNVEMASLAQNASSFASADGNGILNECRSIDKGIDQIEGNLNQLRMLQDRSLNEAETSGSATTRQLDALSSETMSMYRQLTERVRQVKSQREAQQPKNSPQVGRVDRRLKQAIQSYQQVESAFRKKTQDQMARQYRIVNPEASESEVRAVVEDTSSGGQVFQQAMMQSDRRGQARAVLNAVQDRHAELQKIEQQMIELAQLFQDMDTLIIQQDVQVAQIEQKGEEALEHLDKGNEEIAVAVTTARKTRKKKWICLGICVAIILIIVIIVVVYIFVNKQANGGKKRSIEVRGLEFANEAPVAQIAASPRSTRLGRHWVRVGVPLHTDANAEGKRSSLPGGVFNEHATALTATKRYVINTDFTGGDVAGLKPRYIKAGVPFDGADAES